MFRKKRVITAICAALFAVSLFSCTAQQDAGGDVQQDAGEKGALFAEPTKISILMGSHASWPYQEDWVFWKYFEEATNADFDIQAVPNTELDTKITLMMANPSSLPDLIHTITKTAVDTFASSGAFIAIDDHLDEMPNYTRFWNSLPEEERDELLVQRISPDGKTYFPATYMGQGGVVNDRAWLYRKDIFEKHQLDTPKTMEELYQVGLKLKELYPDSYPVCMRTGFAMLDVTSAAWKPYFTFNAYYDYQDGHWKFGAVDPIMPSIVEYWIKMEQAGILPPDYLTMEAKSWEELMSTDRGFITADYLTRIDFFNIPNRERNPDYTLAVMEPPRAEVETGQNKLSKKTFDPTGYLICNTGKEQNIQNAIKLIDWMYSDEAAELLSWGKEGESYEVVDGKRRYLISGDEQVRTKFGALTYGLYLRLDPEALLASASEEQNENARILSGYVEDKLNPINWLPYNEEELKINDELGFAINSYTKEMLSKFLLRQEPMSGWDSFVQDLYDMGLEEYLQMLEGAYNRTVQAEAQGGKQ